MARFVSAAARGEAPGGVPVNTAIRHAFKLLRSEAARVDAGLLDDFQSVMEGEAIYLPGFFSENPRDYSLLQCLMADLEQAGREGMFVDWSRHLKFDNPDFSPTFQRIIKRMDEWFDVEIFASRLNFYRDGTDWKPFHHDSHAYGAGGKKEDFTVGASFGGERSLAFQHPSGHEFTIPQRNGDIFAFTSKVNKRFKHGVPKARTVNIGPRFSIIAWGRRRTLNERNGGGVGPPCARTEEAAPRAPARAPAAASHPGDGTGTSAEDQGALDVGQPPKPMAVSVEEVAGAVRRFVEAETRRGAPGTARGLAAGAGALRDNNYRPRASTTGAKRCGADTEAETRSARQAAAEGAAPKTYTGSHPQLVAKLKRSLGAQYEPFRALAVRYQHGALPVEQFVADAAEMTGGRAAPLLAAAARALPDAARRTALLQALCA